jgi:hypothetical protein
MIQEIKKTYSTGETVWIYGISSNKNKLTKGKVIKKIDLESAGYSKDQFFYIVSIDTAIEPLLEIRTWETISQDDQGPVGGLREVHDQIDIDSTSRMLSEFGYSYQSNSQEDPTPDEIHAAILKSQQQSTHSPLILKESRPTRRRYFKKKKV